MKYCSNCGQPMEDNAHFCSNCGQHFINETKSAETSAIENTNEWKYGKNRFADVKEPAGTNRKGMKISCWVFAILGIISIVMAFTDDYSMMAMAGFCFPLAGMFYILSKTPKKSKYILGATSGISKSLFVTCCIVLSFVLFMLLDNEYGLPEVIETQENTRDAYDTVIENLNQYLQGEDYDEDLVPDTVYLQRAREQGDAESVGYALEDLDEDGSDELLIGYIPPKDFDGGADTDFWLLYTIRDGKAKLVTESWDRNRHYLCSDGTVYWEGSDGASASYVSRMQFEYGELFVTETAFTGLDKEGQICYCYTDFGSGVMESSKDIRGRDVTAADRNDLTEDEWKELTEEWSYNRKTVDYRPLTD